MLKTDTKLKTEQFLNFSVTEYESRSQILSSPFIFSLATVPNCLLLKMNINIKGRTHCVKCFWVTS